jgi:hypothetical protein
MNGTTDKQEIVVAPQASTALEAWGVASDLDLLANRFTLFFGVDKDERDAARPAALKAAQLTMRYGMTPGVHVYLVKRGGRWGAEDALEAWKVAADKHAFLGRFRYDVQFREMTPDEVKANTPEGARCTTADKGFFARVVRFDLAREAKEVGLSYDPPWVTGFWRKESYSKNGSWVADTIPNQRTAADVAHRRAHKAALKATFTLIQLDDFDQRAGSVERAEQWRLVQAARLMDAEMTDRAKPDGEEEGAGFVEKSINYEDDGDVLFA